MVHIRHMTYEQLSIGRKVVNEVKDRTILHSDINCCYAAIEHLHHPELEGKPLAVGGDPEARHGTLAGKAGLSGNQFHITEDGFVPKIFKDGS